jgi:hypothetical protein
MKPFRIQEAPKIYFLNQDLPINLPQAISELTVKK